MNKMKCTLLRIALKLYNLSHVFPDSRAAAGMLKTADVNVITCLLKMYLRELPEALFTDALYPNFVSGMG